MKRRKASAAHFQKLREKRTKATTSSQVFMTAFLKGSNSSASSGIPANQQIESVVLKNLNDESVISQDQENESSLLQFDQSISSEEQNDLEQLDPDVEVLQFSENTAIGNKSFEDVSSASIPTKKDGEVFALIGDVNTGRSALQDMGAWQNRISDSFRDFMVKKGTSQLQNSDSHFPEDESGQSLAKQWLEKNSKMVRRCTAFGCAFIRKMVHFSAYVVHFSMNTLLSSEISVAY
jgi:hypothetical protein